MLRVCPPARLVINSRVRAGKCEEAAQRERQCDGREADVETRVRWREVEFDAVFSRRKLDAAHGVIAAQELLRFAIDEHLPLRIEAVVEQQHGRLVCVGFELN